MLKISRLLLDRFGFHTASAYVKGSGRDFFALKKKSFCGEGSQE